MVRNTKYNFQEKIIVGTSISVGVQESDIGRDGILIQNRSETASVYYYLTEEATLNDAGFVILPGQVHYFDNVSPKNKIWFNSTEENTDVVVMTTVLDIE